MKNRKIIIGSRGSKLALIYAEKAREKILKHSKDFGIEEVIIKEIVTKGDQVQDKRLSEVGGKGLFSKTIEVELLEKKISGAPVLNKSGKLVGIISESDIMKNIVDSQYYNMPITKTNVSKYMKKSVDYISPDITIFEAASEFLKLKRKRFPVIISGEIVGIISRIDIISASLHIRSQIW